MSRIPKDNFPIVIGIAGYKRSGKDTIAGQIGFNLVKFNFFKNSEILIEKFAKGVKQEVCEAFDISLEHLDKRKNESALVRRVIQTVGTEWGREEKGKDVWVNQVEERIKKNPNTKIVFITDLRFISEADWIRNKNGFIVRVERKGQVNTDLHASEVEVDKIPSPDYRITNDGVNLNALAREVKFLTDVIVDTYGLK